MGYNSEEDSSEEVEMEEGMQEVKEKVDVEGQRLSGFKSILKINVEDEINNLGKSAARKLIKLDEIIYDLINYTKVGKVLTNLSDAFSLYDNSIKNISFNNEPEKWTIIIENNIKPLMKTLGINDVKTIKILKQQLDGLDCIFETFLEEIIYYTDTSKIRTENFIYSITNNYDYLSGFKVNFVKNINDRIPKRIAEIKSFLKSPKFLKLLPKVQFSILESSTIKINWLKGFTEGIIPFIEIKKINILNDYEKEDQFYTRYKYKYLELYNFIITLA